MKAPVRSLVRPLGTLALSFLASAVCHADGLLANGSFDHKDGPLTGWTTDYAFSGNSNYVGNKDRVTVVAGRAVIKPASDDGAGAKMECIPIAFEPGFKYTAKLDVKGGPYRIYFAGYKWKPGIRPHENPELGELRMIYKSKAAEGSSSGSKRETIELPGVKLSAQAKSAIKGIRFISLFIYVTREGSIDNVTITKTPDPQMKF